MESVGTLIVGAGVVGLAIARELARTGREVIIVEQASRFGTGISARNSEVIHAGIYYEPRSLKAATCLAGARLLIDYCQERDIPWRQVGKLIVANGAGQRDALRRLLDNAQRCGAAQLQWCEANALHRLEPALRAEAAILSPATGIVDSHALMTALLADAERAGAVLLTRSEVTAARVLPSGFEVELRSGQTTDRVRAGELINAAGLGALPLARRIDGLSPSSLPQAYFAKGSWFAPPGRVPFSRLIYPVPEPGGLGVHLTLDLAGRARFGPDVEWVREIDYRIDSARAEVFRQRVQEYWPDVPELQPGEVGIRPKLSGSDEPSADFRIDGPRRHGIPGLVQLFGIESPGLTASMALAEYVRAELARISHPRRRHRVAKSAKLVLGERVTSDSGERPDADTV